MGSGYQFPQSSSLGSFGKVRDPSFSSYLNDADGQIEVKLAELARLGSGSEGRVQVDAEIGVFRADKYFNEVLEDEEKPKESELRRSAVEESKRDSVTSPARSKISLGTPSIRSESSSRHSQTALLQSFPTQVVLGRRSTGEVQRKKGFLSRICCRCSCVSKKSLNIEDRHVNSKDDRSEPYMNRADQLLQVTATTPKKPWMKDSKMLLYPSVTPALLGKAINSPVLSRYPSPNLHKSVKEGSQGSHYTADSFNPPAIGNVRKSISLERKLNLLTWDKLNTKLEDAHIPIPSTISVEYYTDAESDASSDLFEIDSFTGQRKPSFSSQIPDSSASGYATPTTGYAPSEASIDWSVVTASAVDFSNMSDCEDFKAPKSAPITQNNRYAVTEKHNQNKVNSTQSLLGWTNHKAGRKSENTDLHKTRENVNYQQRMDMDQYVPFSRVQGQASSHPSSVMKVSFRQKI